jgi:hypothetical protein
VRHYSVLLFSRSAARAAEPNRWVCREPLQLRHKFVGPQYSPTVFNHQMTEVATDLRRLGVDEFVGDVAKSTAVSVQAR